MTYTELHATRCPICKTQSNATELYSANFSPDTFNSEVFSARRLPDHLHYRLVKCRTCGLVRSDPIADPEFLAQLYAQSAFNYSDEVANITTTYGYYLNRLTAYGVKKNAVLEIGCGNGFMLEEALTQGYARVQGVEPSIDAIAKACSQVRPHIIADVMRADLFEPAQFDAICMFQVFDHAPEPGTLLDECLRVLKPGGLILTVNHNVEALSARLLGERSPIIDIEHTYLYSPNTMARMFAAHGLEVRDIGSVSNRYSLYYLARLVPFPAPVKNSVLKFFKSRLLAARRVSVRMGNLYCIAQRPGQDP